MLSIICKIFHYFKISKLHLINIFLCSLTIMTFLNTVSASEHNDQLKNFNPPESDVITSLDFYNKNVGKNNIEGLDQILSTDFSLTSLNLGSNSTLGLLDLDSLSWPISHNSALKELILKDNPLLLSEKNAYLFMVPGGSLKDDELSVIEEQEFSIQDIFTRLLSGYLTTLNLENTGLHHETVGDLCIVLANNKNLTNLNLSHNQINNLGTEKISQALITNRTLQKINLKQNLIGDQGAISLAKMLESNDVITGLNLSMNQIGSEGITTLSKALEKNKTLLELELENNSADKGIIYSVWKLFGSNRSQLHDINQGLKLKKSLYEHKETLQSELKRELGNLKSSYIQDQPTKKCSQV